MSERVMRTAALLLTFGTAGVAIYATLGVSPNAWQAFVVGFILGITAALARWIDE